MSSGRGVAGLQAGPSAVSPQWCRSQPRASLRRPRRATPGAARNTGGAHGGRRSRGVCRRSPQTRTPPLRLRDIPPRTREPSRFPRAPSRRMNVPRSRRTAIADGPPRREVSSQENDGSIGRRTCLPAGAPLSVRLSVHPGLHAPIERLRCRIAVGVFDQVDEGLYVE